MVIRIPHPGDRKHRITHRHRVIESNDGKRLLFFCSRRLLPQRHYRMWMKRGDGFLWEEVPPPGEDEDMDSWARTWLRP